MILVSLEICEEIFFAIFCPSAGNKNHILMGFNSFWANLHTSSSNLVETSVVGQLSTLVKEAAHFYLNGQNLHIP